MTSDLKFVRGTVTCVVLTFGMGRLAPYITLVRKTSDILDHSMIATDTQAMTAPTASRVTPHTARLEAGRRAPTMIVAQLFHSIMD
jgi:hypothetical protein